MEKRWETKKKGMPKERKQWMAVKKELKGGEEIRVRRNVARWLGRKEGWEETRKEASNEGWEGGRKEEEWKNARMKGKNE